MEERERASREQAGALAHSQGQRVDERRMNSRELRRAFSFTTKDFIGGGGFGKVYLGTYVRTGRKYAVKVVGLTSEEVDDRWKREFDFLLTFDHPNIIKMFCYAVGDTQGYIVTEAADTDLRMLLDKREGLLSAEFSKSCVEQMLFGLTYLHARAVVHRDVKPSNTLLLIEHMGETLVKLCDLGLARHSPSTSAGPNREVTALVQTAGYRAPEVVATEGTEFGYCHPELDTWGVGCLALELLTRIRALPCPALPCLALPMISR